LSAITSPSELDKRVTFQSEIRIPDGMGGFTVVWNGQATVWAAIWPVSASETIQAAQATMTVTHRIRIRYRSVLKPSWRISWAGRYFNIVSIIDPNMAHRWLDILCREAA
jgi:SPP1 family predicted phage head-tail adaptor